MDRRIPIATGYGKLRANMMSEVALTSIVRKFLEKDGNFRIQGRSVQFVECRALFLCIF
jgi:hypothetical protein